jgi:hypothetical protein
MKIAIPYWFGALLCTSIGLVYCGGDDSTTGTTGGTGGSSTTTTTLTTATGGAGTTTTTTNTTATGGAGTGGTGGTGGTTGGSAGTTSTGCPTTQPAADSMCTTLMLSCPYGNTTCRCAGGGMRMDAGGRWDCTTTMTDAAPPTDAPACPANPMGMCTTRDQTCPGPEATTCTCGGQMMWRCN